MIDLGPYLAGVPGALETVAAELRFALEDIGDTSPWAGRRPWLRATACLHACLANGWPRTLTTEVSLTRAVYEALAALDVSSAD